MLSPEEKKALFREHKTSEKGLSAGEAESRLQRYGRNEIKGKKRKPLIVMFLEEFTDLMVIILIAASVLAFIGGEITDASVIMFIVILNAIIGFIQKFKAEKAIEALKKMVAPTARIIRDGAEIQIDAKLVVPGDILILNEGDNITADAVLLEANELETMEATLTGESTPSVKFTHDIEETKGTEAERENVVFMGTNVSHGTGKAVVIATGMETQMGKIATLTTETKKDKSPLEKELFRLGMFVGKVSLGISAILILVGLLVQQKPFVETLLFATAVAVAAVPEGLPATITIALAIGVQRLAKKNAIMKQLSSIETLGSTTVICSDKTGTLTKNEMTVKEIHFNGHMASVHGVGYAPSGYINIQKDGKNLISLGKEHLPYQDYEISSKTITVIKKNEPLLYDSLKLFIAGAALCNNASLSKNEENWQMLGDPTEGALLTLAEKSGFNKNLLEKEYSKIHEYSFDSTRKRMTVIVKTQDGKYFAFTKGAPDSILDICSRFMDNGSAHKMEKKVKDRYLSKNTEMAKKALRVLGIAYREVGKEEYEGAGRGGAGGHKKIEKDMIFLGLAGMIDPPRPEVKAAVEMAHKANIRIYVITGDHGLTAEAIAKQLGIIDQKRKYQIITGEDLNNIKDEQLKKLLADKKSDIIFARVSPQHKLRIVTQLKKMNEVVAVTGDGVNDAPALKKADIGIAMGITGTDVSKEASNMVLADDSFSTIVMAVKEGRTIYNNLKKFVFYIFSCNIGELFTIFAAIILAIPAPLTAVLILAVDLGTDVLPAVALGVDPSEPGTMDKKPRNPKEKIMNKRFAARFLYLGAVIGLIVMVVYISTLYRYGWTWGETLADDSLTYLKGATVAFATLVIIQMVNVFNARSETNSIFRLGIFSNMWLIGAITISIILTIMMTEVPLLQHYLGTTGLNALDWTIIVGSSMLVLVVEETRKIFVRRKAALESVA